MAKPNQPALFRPFRALGYITDNVPFAIQRRGKETFVTVSVGKAWQIYNSGKLTLVLVGPQLPASISALAAKGDLTFAAVGNVIVECKRVHKSGVYQGHTGTIIQLLVLGDLLMSLGADGQLLVWEIGNRETPKASITFPSGFVPTCMAHPDTYVNKVVVGSQGGQLALYNFISGTLLYTFSGWDGVGVRAVVSSPALDVVGVGLADGRAVLLNLKFDETIAVFSNAAGVGLSSGLMLGSSGSGGSGSGSGSMGACTTLAFRSGAGVPLMAAGGGTGVITLWDLEQRRLYAVIQDAHDMPLTHLHFFAGEPLLMSAGQDNALKQWVFDTAEPKPRLLRFRSGHAAPPTVVRHYGEGLRLLSAGSDRAFRVFSTIQDQQSRELSQKHTARRAKKLKVREADLKLGRVTCLDACTVRERDWANVLTGHENDPVAYVWRLAHFTLGEHELRPPQDQAATQAAMTGSRRRAPLLPSGGRINAPVTSVALSPCGNFGLVGTAAGRVDRYNMQSGLHRGVYGRVPPTPTGQQPTQPPSSQQGVTLMSAHEGSVTGMMVDSCNKLLVTVGLDGWLRIWDFKTHKVRCEVNVGSSCTHLSMAPGSGLVAVACDDLVLRCFDVEAAGRLVRRFKGHRDRITCIQLSSDSRWLLSSSMDGTLRTWDVPAAQCLQVLRLGAPLTSFSLSPALDILSTCHVNRRGVYLWSNQAVFGNPADFTHSTKTVEVTLPSVADGLPQGLDSGEKPVDKTGGAGTGAGVEIQLVCESDEDEGVGMDVDEEGEGDGVQGTGVVAEGVVDGVEGTGRAVDARTGAPVPLAPALVTLSLLPRAQWHSLLHLESIKARNKPIEPPKKPDAAPFFLPTVAGLSSQPVFDTVAAGTGTNPDGGADPASDAGGVPTGPAVGIGGSKVIRAKAGGGGGLGAGEGVHRLHAGSEFLRLLRSGQEAGDWSSFIAHVRGISPATLDREVRALQILTDGSDEDDVLSQEAAHDVCALLEALDTQLTKGADFEFVAALLQLVLQVHGDAIMVRPVLLRVAGRVHKKLGGLWTRVDGLLADVRCMTAFFGNLQG